MKELCILMLTLGSTFILNVAFGDDRVEVDGTTFINTSKSFEYKCDLNWPSVNAQVYVDLDYKTTEDKSTSRVAMVSSQFERDYMRNQIGIDIVGAEMIVMSTSTVRCPCLDKIFTIGDEYHDRGTMASMSLRIREIADGSVELTSKLYDYDLDFNRSTVGTFTGKCSLNTDI